MVEPSGPKVGVGAVIWRAGEVLLVRRGKAPLAGQWSLPGGAQERGETLIEALLREVQEETGVSIVVLGLIDVVDAIFRDPSGETRHHYTLIDFSARWIAGEARAGSDAAQVGWFAPERLGRLALWSETQRIIDMSARLHGPFPA